jgi:hypothetical protein
MDHAVSVVLGKAEGTRAQPWCTPCETTRDWPSILSCWWPVGTCRACATGPRECGLRVADSDFMRGVILPMVQYPSEPLKTRTSTTPIPIPTSLSRELAAHVARWRSYTLLTNAWGDQLSPRSLQRALVQARSQVPGLAPNYRYQDLRHYLASMLIAAARTSRSSKPGSDTPVRRPPSTPTVTSGPTPTRAVEQPWTQYLRLAWNKATGNRADPPASADGFGQLPPSGFAYDRSLRPDRRRFGPHGLVWRFCLRTICGP